jgi:hypothetical protein
MNSKESGVDIIEDIVISDRDNNSEILNKDQSHNSILSSEVSNVATENISNISYLAERLSSWAYEFVYSSTSESTTRRKKWRNSTDSRNSFPPDESEVKTIAKISEPDQTHVNLSESTDLASSKPKSDRDSPEEMRDKDKAARWKDVGGGVGTVYIYFRGVQKVP